MAEDIPFLNEVACADVSALRRARQNYGESWCKRGGVGAFMMLARKWDRLENHLTKDTRKLGLMGTVGSAPYDILGAIRSDERAEGVIDDIRDLRRYLMLVEAKAAELGYKSALAALPKDQTLPDMGADVDLGDDPYERMVKEFDKRVFGGTSVSGERQMGKSPALGAPYAGDAVPAAKTNVTPEQLNNAVDYVRKLEAENKKLRAAANEVADEVDSVKAQLAEAKAAVMKLQRFKDWVHARMDDLGVPTDPYIEKTQATGCRIGSRFEYLEAALKDPNGRESAERIYNEAKNRRQPRASELHPG